MRIFWTLFKVIIGLAVAIPLAILAAALALGLLGTLFGLAFVALRLAFIGLIGYGLYRVGRAIFSPSRKAPAPPVKELPQPDPYYQAAMRELDAELGPVARG